MTSTTLPEIFHGLPQSRQARVDTLRQLGHDHFLLNSFTFITCRPSLIDLHLQTDLTNCLSQAVSHKPCLTNSLTGRLSQTMSHKPSLTGRLSQTMSHKPSLINSLTQTMSQGPSLTELLSQTVFHKPSLTNYHSQPSLTGYHRHSQTIPPLDTYKRS